MFSEYENDYQKKQQNNLDYRIQNIKLQQHKKSSKIMEKKKK